MIKISIVGTHGIPARYGGFETFAEEISTLFLNEGYKVEVQCDASEHRIRDWNGAGLFYSRFTKTGQPLRYYYSGLSRALKYSDIIIVAGTVGSMFYFLNLFKRKVIITNTDGIEYYRPKWSIVHRLFLRISELLAIRFSDVVIADSESIRDFISAKYRFRSEKIRVIEYGSVINNKYDPLHLEKYGLAYKAYYLVVCRLEPENNLNMMIEGYLGSGSAIPLVIIGNLTKTRFVRNLLRKYRSDKVIFLGGIYERAVLNSLRFGCKAYLHGHSVGGTNPSLLEAMGNGNLIICHDNIFNREVTANELFYFSDSEGCSVAIRNIEKLTDSEIGIYREKSYKRIREYYNWENIVKKYTQLFQSILPESIAR